MNTSIDEDFVNYLSALSPQQQKQLDDFVSFSDHAIVSPPPPVANTGFAYGNGVGANHYFGRPLSVYEPFVPGSEILGFIQENEFSSLPPDLVSSSNPNICDDLQFRYWEAEDAEYIETLNELRDNFDDQSHYTKQTQVVADVHYDPDETHIYATVNKPKKIVENPMIASDRSASDPPREKFPKIMTESCYGQLNNPSDLLWNSYEQDLVNSTENIVEDGDFKSSQVISSLMTDSSIIDSMSSSINFYEQIPSMTSSGGQRKNAKIKWWDDHREHTEKNVVDLHGMAEEGEFMFRFLIF